MVVRTHFMDGDDNHLLAGTMTLRKAIDVAKDRGLYEVLFETYKETLVKIINGKGKNKTTTCLIVKVMRKKLQRFQCARISFGDRNGNQTTHVS